MKKIIAILICLTALLLLAGCGGSGEKETTAVTQFEIKIDGKAVTLGKGESVSCRDGEITRTVSEREKFSSGELTVCGVGCGSTLDEVLTAMNAAPGQASFDYEYDPYGDGCTEVGEQIYDGTVVSAEKVSALDVALNLYYTYEDGSWVPVDLNEKKTEDLPEVLRICFDCEGVHDLYGKQPGEVFSVECGILTK